VNTDELKASFYLAKISAMRVVGGGEAEKDLSLKDIFRLNNSIGRLASLHPEERAQLKELQGDVNLITVGVKNAKREDIERGLELTEKAIESISSAR